MTEGNAMEREYRIKNSISCTKCGRIVPVDNSTFERFFNLQKDACPYCKAELDLWETIKVVLQRPAVTFGMHYVLLGCQGNWTNILLEPNKIYTLDLTKEIGDGELLYITYTPDNGGLFPVEWRNNVPDKHIRRKIINLIPHYIPIDGKAPRETKVNVLYWFASKEICEDISTMLMVDAFERFYEKNYRYMLISTQTAIEKLQYQFFSSLLQTGGLSKERIENFLEEKATFSIQLFTLVPLFAKIMKFPSLTTEINKGLKILRDGRNDVVHEGKLSSEFDEKDMKLAILSAFFTFKYFKVIHKIS